MQMRHMFAPQIYTNFLQGRIVELTFYANVGA